MLVIPLELMYFIPLPLLSFYTAAGHRKARVLIYSRCHIDQRQRRIQVQSSIVSLSLCLSLFLCLSLSLSLSATLFCIAI